MGKELDKALGEDAAECVVISRGATRITRVRVLGHVGEVEGAGMLARVEAATLAYRDAALNGAHTRPIGLAPEPKPFLPTIEDRHVICDMGKIADCMEHGHRPIETAPGSPAQVGLATGPKNQPFGVQYYCARCGLVYWEPME